jgi:SAM-dependent methyltransferase
LNIVEMPWSSPLQPYRFREYKAVLVASFTSKAGRVLEVGCGPGRYASFSKAEDYVGVDIGWSPDVRASAVALPFRDGCFDRVVMMDVIEHVADVDRVLSECWRVLRTGGLLMILTPNTLGFGVYDSFADPTHIHHFTWHSLERRFLSHGIHVLARIPLHLHIAWPLKHLRSGRLIYLQQSICLLGVKKDG